MTRKKETPVGGLTKAQLVDVVYARHGGLTKNEAAEIVEAIFTTVKSTLGAGRPVRITNFGTFEVTSRPGRKGVNPTNGESLFIPAHKGLSFRPARRLKKVVAKPKKGTKESPSAKNEGGKGDGRPAEKRE